jgi:hypothetical protein
LDDVYIRAARELGRLMGERGHGLVYGAGNLGLMGVLAKAVRGAGGHVTGIIPERLVAYGISLDQVDELIITETMAERKAMMESRAEAFVALPGGFGTLEELLQVLTLVQLRYLDAPVVLLNTAGFYNPLLACFEQFYALRFARPEMRESYRVLDEPSDVLAFVEGFHGITLPPKGGVS